MNQIFVIHTFYILLFKNIQTIYQQIASQMNQLERKMRQRQIKMGLVPDEVKVEEKKPVVSSINVNDKQKQQAFLRKQQMIENMMLGKMGGKSSVQDEPVKKEQIKGNADNFANARKILQQGLNKNSNQTFKPITAPSLPMGSLPPPPPPPPSLPLNLPIPPPPLNLPPPPILGNLPPPPILGKLPPPPSISNLPKPTSLNSPNLPSPPPLNVNSVQKQSEPVKQQLNPIKTENKQIKVQNQLPPQEIKANNHPTQIKQVNLPPPPPPPPLFIIPNQQKVVQRQQPEQSQPKQSEVHVKRQQKTLLQRRQTKRRIFDNNNKLPPVTKQFFQKDIAALIKRQFIRQNDILGIIGIRIPKRMYSFNFPSIENKYREIEPIQTLYADVANLDLVSCYMQKNMNAIKPHNQAREQFVGKLQNYNWGTDPMRLKPIRETAQNVNPNIDYRQLNFVQIKNCLNRCDNLINKYIKQENFKGCQEMKNLRQETIKLVQKYCKQPQKYANTYQQIEKNIYIIKDTK